MSIDTLNGSPLKSRSKRLNTDHAFKVLCILTTMLSMGVLGVLLTTIWSQGHEYLSLDFLHNSPSRKPERAGIYPAMIGTLWICSVCVLVAVPIGVGTAILLEEYQPKHPWLKRIHAFVQLNITNLAGVPSVVYGIIGMTVFVQMFGLGGHGGDPLYELGTPDNWYYLRLPFGRGVFAGGLTLMLVVMPVVIVAASESIRAVPNSLRQASFGLGSTRWQMVWNVTLPSAIGGIMTGTILAMSRAIGEAAPILILGGIVYITFTPEHLMDDFTAMPLQIFDWASRPQEAFHRVAAAGILTLLVLLLCTNALAILIRHKYQRRA